MHAIKDIAWDTSHLLGWKKGLEPSTFGTTIRRSNQLSYIHRLTPYKSSTFSKNTNLAMSHISPLCMGGLLIALTLLTNLAPNIKEANTTQRRTDRTILSSS